MSLLYIPSHCNFCHPPTVSHPPRFQYTVNAIEVSITVQKGREKCGQDARSFAPTFIFVSVVAIVSVVDKGAVSTYPIFLSILATLLFTDLEDIFYRILVAILGPNNATTIKSGERKKDSERKAPFYRSITCMYDVTTVLSIDAFDDSS